MLFNRLLVSKRKLYEFNDHSGRNGITFYRNHNAIGMSACCVCYYIAYVVENMCGLRACEIRSRSKFQMHNKISNKITFDGILSMSLTHSVNFIRPHVCVKGEAKHPNMNQFQKLPGARFVQWIMKIYGSDGPYVNLLSLTFEPAILAHEPAKVDYSQSMLLFRKSRNFQFILFKFTNFPTFADFQNQQNGRLSEPLLFTCD